MVKKLLHSIFVLFSRLKFKYKLTIYFTLFGLFVGYLSLIFYTTAATNNMKIIISGIVDDWLVNNNQPADIIETFIGKPYDNKMNAVFPFITASWDRLPAERGDKNFDIYYYSSRESRWFKLYCGRSGKVLRGALNAEEITEITAMPEKETISISHTPFYGRRDNVYFWINLTRTYDKNKYIIRIVSDRKGVFAFIGGRDIAVIYTMALFFISLFLSRGIALHISKPISKLSRQTSGIADGDLDIRTEILSKDEIGKLSLSVNKMADKIKDTIESMDKRMTAISVMNMIDKAVLSSISRSDLIDRVTNIVSDLFSDCMVALAIADTDREKYVILSHYIKGIKRSQGEGVTLTFNSLGDENIKKNKDFFIIDKLTDEEYLKLVNSLIHQNYLQIMNIPVILDEEYIGSLIVGKDADRPFTEFEAETLKVLADQTGVAMKSVKFFEEKENLFLGILIALSKTIDAKSKWTYGHSERVAGHAVKLAVLMGMDETFLADLRVAANLHDIGKIGVPETILDKPGKLSGVEFDIIRKHPQDGASIIEEIPGYEKFINGIFFHHEAWNGSGYPLGLKGREIPLMGRLIAVADVYDSLISDRPYRSGISDEEALAILISEKGKKLDPDIVDLMVGIIKSEKNSI